MIYYTGDIHGNPNDLIPLLQKAHTTNDDTIVILGDVGVNFFQNRRDIMVKDILNGFGPTMFCIHGNHEIRPQTIPTYQIKEWAGGKVWYEEEFPNLLFARDGDIFTMDGIRHLVIGGAYSVDKLLRLAQGGRYWWPDEQPSAETKKYVEQQIASNPFDVILSHTCPLKYEPVEAFLSGIDQSTVDDSTERWLDRIESQADYKAWLCGHWHIEKKIDRMRFLYHGFLSSDDMKREYQI